MAVSFSLDMTLLIPLKLNIPARLGAVCDCVRCLVRRGDGKWPRHPSGRFLAFSAYRPPLACSIRTSNEARDCISDKVSASPLQQRRYDTTTLV